MHVDGLQANFLLRGGCRLRQALQLTLIDILTYHAERAFMGIKVETVDKVMVHEMILDLDPSKPWPQRLHTMIQHQLGVDDLAAATILEQRAGLQPLQAEAADILDTDEAYCAFHSAGDAK